MPSAAVYSRVSTDQQSIDHQEDNLLEYASELGFDVKADHVIRDKSTGTDVDRSGYRQLMELVEDGAVDAVVVRSISRISRNMRDLHETVGGIVEDEGLGIFVKNDGIEIAPGEDLDMRDKILLNTLGMAAELEAEMLSERTLEGLRAAEAEGKWTGRPPYGFTTDPDGYLQPNENYASAVDAIEAVEEGMSDNKASRHTGVPRRTIPNILERKDLYLNRSEADLD